MKPIESEKKFKEYIAKIKKTDGYREPIGFGIARVDRGQLHNEKILQATFPVVNWRENYASAAAFIGALIESEVEVDFSGSEFTYDVKKKFVKNAISILNIYLKEAYSDAHINTQVIKTLYRISQNEGLENNFRIVFLFEDTKCESIESVYLKLYALSLGKAPLRSLNLNGIFGLLENVAWCVNVPIEIDWLKANEIELKLEGSYPFINAVDKFPRFLQHIIPEENVRIMDASKVRMGAYLAKGTALMPGASYINFNAGTTGAVMVEGRISSSVVVGDGSDIGGGASVLGVLSGTNGNPVSIGKNTLLGANSVTGVPLGDGCIVDAGVAVLEGTKVFISKEQIKLILEINPKFKFKQQENNGGYIFKAIELSNLNGLHFRRDSQTGMMTVSRSNRKVVLNADLH